MARINLLPWRAERRKARQKEFVAMLGLSALAAAALSVLIVFYYSNEISGQQKRNEFLDGQIVEVDKKIKEIEELDKKKAKPAVAAAIKRVNLLASGAECRSLSSREYANEYVKNGRIAEVAMECTVPALNARLQEVLASKGAPAKLKTKKLLEGVAEFDRALGQAGSRTIPAKLTLYASAKGQPWSTGAADDIVETVHNGMYAAAAE